MDSWDEVRTAYQVARNGTVSGAAEVLGVHHATVIRHIDAIEGQLGVKLFQRHPRGYTPTEAGAELLRVAQATDDQFSQLVARLQGQGSDVSGELVVTSLSALAPVLIPVLAAFQRAHPGLIVRYLTSGRLFRLEYGEAHVAVRAGSVPDQPDNVVQPFVRQQIGLYASEAYVAEAGQPAGVEEFGAHRFIGPEDLESRAPFNRWLRAHVADENIAFRLTDEQSVQDAVLAGAGIGFLSEYRAAQLTGIVRIMKPREDWTSPLWLVTHVDLHRTGKVQSFLSFLKTHSKGWNV